MPDLLTLDQLTVRDDRALRRLPLYRALHDHLRRSDARFYVCRPGAGWRRALYLNLTCWNAAAPVDTLEDATIDADVIAHAAWHSLARRALSPGPERPTAEALLLGEAVASAFDLYLVGHLLRAAPRCGFLKTQLPAMTQVAEDAGTPPDAFAATLQAVADDPDRAFEDLRQLLFDATTALLRCHTPAEADQALAAHDGHRFAPLLHHYELSTWVLYARAYAPSLDPDPVARRLDADLRAAPSAVALLEEAWVREG